ncbi:MAG: long-chain fatty acid--CoA ligase, partial [Rhodospirillaceae bacterium]|nr:long-chain fatty acid--CoA ligase [Rhodospirillaceae bacterium]
RAKELIIRGGVNIAPLEIDNIVMQHGDVMEVCTIGAPDAIYGEAIICYVVPRTGRSLTTDDIAQHCTGLLPDFKQPSEIVVVDGVARNTRGKVDRKAMKDIWTDTHPGSTS